MKRTLISLLSLLALFTITSCQKDATGDGSQFRATMESTADGKTVLSGTALNWVSGDQVAIYGTAGRGLYAATPQTPATVATLDNVSGETGNGPFRAFYPSSLTSDGATIALPYTQTYVENSINEFPMYAESATNQLAFKNLCGVLKLHLTKANTNITTISVTANAEICGDYTVSYVNDVPYLSHTGNGSNTVTLTCATAQSIDNGRDFYIYLPATFDSLKSIELNTADGRYCVKTVKSNVCINVQRSAVTEIEFDESDMNFVEPLPQGALPGLFSVSATQQVRFSQGNLRYQASTQTWQFTEHQYDSYVGHANSNISTTYSGWIDLLGWGTGNNPTLASTNENDYSTFVDWGVNPISNGGNVANSGWRTLNNSEWSYILSTRENASDKIASGSVGGVHGLILLPDSWTLPSGCPFTSGFASSWTNWTRNVYTLAQWALMEAAGAVFLPAAGVRRGTSTDYVGNDGIYWSWSYTPNDEYDACTMYSRSDFASISGGGSTRNEGKAVRLVLDNN